MADTADAPVELNQAPTAEAHQAAKMSEQPLAAPSESSGNLKGPAKSSEGGKSQRSSVGGAQLKSLKEVHDDLKKSLYEVKALSTLEEKTGLKREHLAYILAGVTALILAIGGTGPLLLATVLGMAYPAYFSVRALRGGLAEGDRAQVLTVWLGIGVFSVLDICFGTAALYPLLKTAILLYLGLPQTQGAAFLYANAIEPVVVKLEGLLGAKSAR